MEKVIGNTKEREGGGQKMRKKKMESGRSE